MRGRSSNSCSVSLTLTFVDEVFSEGVAHQTAAATRDGQLFRATQVFLTSLRTTPEALLQLVHNRWSLAGWHWIRDTQLHADAHRYQGNGAGVMASLVNVAMN
jgi:hypothetical protein